ncbi:MAG TPA: hypothetical protein DDX98_07515 [Bacteroidales bacterium]|jgi:Zn finger protein HypA/HybF involved in hydrogenase expression|nr:hypothetical protein [Bacteroidales bacterium]
MTGNNCDLKQIAENNITDQLLKANDYEFDMEFKEVNIACSNCDEETYYFSRININLSSWNFVIEGFNCPFCDQNSWYVKIL